MHSTVYRPGKTMADTSTQKQRSAPWETLPADMLASGMRATWIGMLVNVLLIALKLAGGLAGHSRAMLADAAHSLSDFVTDIGVIVGLRYLSKPADSDHAYGHGRVETAISFLMGAAIVATGLGLLKGGAESIIEAFHGVFPGKPGIVALVMGVVSILSKEALFHYTRHEARKSCSRTLEANAWHHRSDALSSVGTVIGVGGALALGNRWTVLDPAAAVVVSVMVIRVGFHIGRSAFRELTDESLSSRSRQAVTDAIDAVDGVRGSHHIRTRSLGRYITVDAHVLVDPTITVRHGHDIATDVENAVRKTMVNAAFVTIHVEPMEE